MSLDPTGRGRMRWTNRWKAALNAFEITFRRTPVRRTAVVGTATVTTQGLTARATRRTKSGHFYLAKTGDSDSATSGDLLMATDIAALERACKLGDDGRRYT